MSPTPFEAVRRALDRLQAEFDDPRLRDVIQPMGVVTAEPMAVDLAEVDDRVVATVDLPGFERDDIEVRVTERTLQIHAERERASTDADQYVRRERQPHTVSRAITLPAAVDPEIVEASMDNGVLTVTMPRRDPVTDRSVEIQ